MIFTKRRNKIDSFGPVRLLFSFLNGYKKNTTKVRGTYILIQVDVGSIGRNYKIKKPDMSTEKNSDAETKTTYGKI